MFSDYSLDFLLDKNTDAAFGELIPWLRRYQAA
jgi:hypothetical protein